MKTFQERLVMGLQLRGWAKVEPTSRYIVMVASHTSEKLFVGVNGALRVGRNVSTSRSIGDPQRQTVLYKEILAAGDKALGVVTPSEIAHLLGR